MFGPNPAAFCHHRSPTFHALMVRTVDLFRLRMGIPDEYDILMLPGSGSLGIEAMIASLRSDLTVLGTGWKFGNRMMEMAQKHHRYERRSRNACGYVHYETSVAGMTGNNGPYLGELPSVVDGVSAFPYYPMPTNAAAYATVSSKQLGAQLNVAVVMVQEDLWGKVFAEDQRESVLNLSWYARAMDANESPVTPMTNALESLYTALLNFPALDDFRAVIDERRARVIDAVGEWAKGHGPTLMVKNVPAAIAHHFDLYPAGPGKHQLFLWFAPNDERDFDLLLKEIRQWKTQTL